jgi:hypothetical protein
MGVKESIQGFALYRESTPRLALLFFFISVSWANFNDMDFMLTDKQ